MATLMPTIDSLLRLAPDDPECVIQHLKEHPNLALAVDTYGYSLMHAAASYSHPLLLRCLVQTYHVSPNIKDLEGETPLFAAETVVAARCLVEELCADVEIKNEEGRTAEENALANIEDGAEWAQVADYLKKQRLAKISAAVTPQTDSNTSEVHIPPPLPPNLSINMRTMLEESSNDDEVPDAGFKTRIDELAAREDFQTEEGQNELRSLITEAISGFSPDFEARKVRARHS